MSEVKVLDVEAFSQRKASISYPYFRIAVVEITPTIVPLLEEGDIPLVGTYQGSTRLLRRISDSAYNVSKLLRTHTEVSYFKSEIDSKLLLEVRDYMDILCES